MERRNLLSVTIVVCVSFLAGSDGLVLKDVSVDACVVSPSQDERQVFYQWPFKLDCASLTSNWSKFFSQPLTDEKCFYSGPNLTAISTDVAVEIPFSDPSQLTYTVYLISDGSCLSQNVSLKVSSIPTQTCKKNVIHDVTLDRNVRHHKLAFGNILDALCLPVPGSGAVIPPAVPQDALEVTWYFSKREKKTNSSVHIRSCRDVGDVFNHDTVYDTLDQDGLEKLIIKANYFVSGVFTCAVTYKNQTAYVSHYSICVRDREEEFFKPEVSCENTLSFRSGQDVSISCNTRRQRKEIKSGDLKVQWRKVGEPFTCDNDLENQQRTSGEAECGLKDFFNFAPKCFEYVPKDEEIMAMRETYNYVVFLRFGSIRKSDAGNYSVRVILHNKTSDVTYVTLAFDRTEELRQLVTNLVAVLVVLALLVFASGLVFYNWTFIKLLVRRHFGKYDKDDRLYVVSIHYAFTNKTTPSERWAIEKIVETVKTKTISLYDKDAYFDSNEELELGFSVEVLLRNLEKCHRMVVVLTEEYVNSRWCRFEAHQGFMNMESNQMKMIFIRTPGAAKALKQNQDEYSRDLRNAIKACRVIDWKPSKPDSRFEVEIEYALPKLNRERRKTEESPARSLAHPLSPVSESKSDMTFYPSTDDNCV